MMNDGGVRILVVLIQVGALPTPDRVATADEKRELMAGYFGCFEDGIR